MGNKVGLLGLCGLIFLSPAICPGEELPKQIPGKDGAPMVLVPAGEFTMGSDDREDSEKPAHQVYLDAFYIDTYEVTVGQYAEFLARYGRLEINGHIVELSGRVEEPPEWFEKMNQPQHQTRPVVNVSWVDADKNCRWEGKRLPTEAEWEKAARGTDERAYPWGNEPPMKLTANFGKDTYNDHAALLPVGSLAEGKSPYGIYDMAGNVSEWVSDWYDRDYYKNSPSQNPKGPEQGTSKVVRGGSWRDGNPDALRSMWRSFHGPLDRGVYVGGGLKSWNKFWFRCAKTP